MPHFYPHIFGVIDNTAVAGVWWTDLKPHCPVYLERLDELIGDHAVRSTIKLMLNGTALKEFVVVTETGQEPIINEIRHQLFGDTSNVREV